MLNISKSDVIGIQPLPSLYFKNDFHIYSEFPSYGLGVILTALRAQGLITGNLIHAASATQITEGIRNAQAVIVGDFRPYAYFCNPAPLILKVLQILCDAQYEGKVLIGGRHIEHLGALSQLTQLFGRLDLRFCAAAADIGRSLGLSELSSQVLGGQALPNPGFIDADYVIDQSLLGSARGDTSSAIGQIMTYSGCRYRCAFCEKAQTPIVPFPRTAIGRQLETFVENDIHYVIVWDEVFGQKGTEPEDFLKEAKTREIEFGCNTRLDVISEPFVERLANHGCKAVLFGVEVSSEEQSGRSLLRLDKGKAPEHQKYVDVTKLLRSYNVKPVASMIIGLPEDTESTVKHRISTVKSYGFEHIYARPLVPFPESQFYKKLQLSQQVPSFEAWNYEELGSYPLGYPTLSSISRAQLTELTRWQP